MNLTETYTKVAIPALKDQFGYKNALATPKIEKVVLNIGLGKGLKDSSFIETAQKTLERITGQKPLETKARKSISNFKIREGMVIGMKVTLHGKRMNDFLEKLINLTLPRVRDFRGLSRKSVDKEGNLNIGIKEHIAFPEIKADEIERIHGLEVAVVTSAKTREEGLVLFETLGFPLQKSEKK